MIGMEPKTEVKKEGKIDKKEGIFSNVLNIIQKEQRLFWLSMLGFLVLYSFLFGLWAVPLLELGIVRTAPVVFLDYLFLLSVSLLASILVVLWKYEKKQQLASPSQVGGTAGVFSVFFSAICPASQSIGIMALGPT